MFSPIGYIPYFRHFMFGPPTIPDLYWNAYSYEERIKTLCMEVDKITKYLDAMTDKLNECISIANDLDAHIEEYIDGKIEAGTFDATIQAAVAAWLVQRGAGSTYDELRDYGFIYGESGE